MLAVAPQDVRGHWLDVAAEVRLLLAAGRYDQAEALARDEVDQLRAQYGEESLQVATASDLLVRALILNGRATRDDTIALVRHAIRIKEARLGAGHADLATSLFNLGDVLAESAEFEDAVAVETRALSLREVSAVAQSVDVAEALDHLGGALSSARRYDEALRALERSLAFKDKLLEQNDVSIARTLEEIALVLQRKGSYQRAGLYLRRAAAIQESAGVDHPLYVRTLNLIAQQDWLEGHLVESRKASERAVAVAERTLRPDHPLVALSTRYLASTLADLGEATRSLALRQQALAMAERN